LKGASFSPHIKPEKSNGLYRLRKTQFKGKKCQGTTLVVPPVPQNKGRALAPEGCFSRPSLIEPEFPTNSLQLEAKG
jgi:hypothetical protein